MCVCVCVFWVFMEICDAVRFSTLNMRQAARETTEQPGSGKLTWDRACVQRGEREVRVAREG